MVLVVLVGGFVLQVVLVGGSGLGEMVETSIMIRLVVVMLVVVDVVIAPVEALVLSHAARG